MTEIRALKPSTRILVVVILCALMGSIACSGVSNNPNTGASSSNHSSSSPAQYMYVGNGSASIAGFQINNDGTLTPLANFPITTPVTAGDFSAAKHTLLVGGSSSGAQATVQLELFDIAPATGALTFESSTIAPIWSAVLDPTAQFVYLPGGVSTNNTFLTVYGYAVSTGNFTPVPGSPYSLALGNGSNALIGQGVQVDPSGKFVYISAMPEEEHTPSPWSGVAAINADGSLSNFTPEPVGCISAADTAVVPQSVGTLVFSSCIDQWSGDYWISAGLINESTGVMTDLGPAWQDPSNTKEITALAADPSGKWLAGLDPKNNVVHIMAISSNGSLTDAADHTVPAGSQPNALSFDKTGRFLYIVNNGSNDMSGFVFDSKTGLVTPIAGSPFPMPQTPGVLVIAQP